MFVIFLVDILSNFLLLMVFNVPISQNTIVITLLFTIILAFILDKAGVLDKGSTTHH